MNVTRNNLDKTHKTVCEWFGRSNDAKIRRCEQNEWLLGVCHNEKGVRIYLFLSLCVAVLKASRFIPKTHCERS